VSEDQASILLTTWPCTSVRRKFAACVAVRQALVVEAEQMQDRRMQVVDVDGVQGGLKAELVVAPWT